MKKIIAYIIIGLLYIGGIWVLPFMVNSELAVPFIIMWHILVPSMIGLGLLLTWLLSEPKDAWRK